MFINANSSEANGAVSIVPVDAESLTDWLEQAGSRTARWVRVNAFNARPGSWLLVPDEEGSLSTVLVGRPATGQCWTLAGLPSVLPAGAYTLASEGDDPFDLLAVGWALGHYRFDRYKKNEPPECQLVVPDDRLARIEIVRDALFQVRDLVNTPAADLGPAELADAAQELSERCGASFDVVIGEQLEKEFPAVHAVGRASSRPPRMIRFEWGDPSHRSLSLVGKGVVFDSGGLSIKPGSGMVLMKKDMGGAAHVLGLAEMIMRLELPIHLRVYIPAVENSISGDAYRPSDIVTARDGTTIEIGNTDAEGRVVLADALSWASEQGTERIIDFATLTGAARVALGEDLPPMYARDTDQARRIQDLSFELEDPLWHMPLYEPYREQIQPKIADLSNTGTTSFGGSLTAALFLDHFVAEGIDWMHFDIYAWNLSDHPGRPAGGEVQGLRTMLAWLEQTYTGDA